MDNLKSKHKRIQPLIKIRKAQLDEETLALNAIRAEKMKALGELRKNQELYIKGVDDINRTRQSRDTRNLLTLESGLDLVKSQWYSALKEVRMVEEKEKAQLMQLMIAQRNLKSLERLADRYDIQLNEAFKKEEQKILDENAARNYKRNA